MREDRYGDISCGRSFVKLINDKLLEEEVAKEVLGILRRFERRLKKIENTKGINRNKESMKIWIEFIGIIGEFGVHHNIIIDGKKTVRVERMLDCIIYHKWTEFKCFQ